MSESNEPPSATDEDLQEFRPDELDGETVACTLTDEHARKRAEWIREDLVEHIEAVERRDDGFALTVAEGGLDAVMRFTKLEHWCCSFAGFELHVTPGEGANELCVYGPEESVEMFDEGFVERLVEEHGVPVVG